MVERFRALHAGAPLLMPNAWDAGSARLLEALGFEALATTSSGFAATLGRGDYGVTRDEALRHAAALVDAVGIPVSADLEDCFENPAETVRAAVDAGLAGCSIEDFSRGAILPVDVAADRVAAAAQAAAGRLVLTARSENFLHDRADLDDIVTRLRAYASAGADVLYAPGVRRLDDIRTLVAAVEQPINVLAVEDAPTVAQLADAGVARISVGGAFAFAALGAVVEAADELRNLGTYGYLDRAAAGSAAAARAFGTL